MISIVVPCYNCENTLDLTIKSLLQQTIWEKNLSMEREEQSYQIVLVNDGSSDSTSVICNDYASRYKNVIKAVHKKNGGLMNAWKCGVGEADGEYIVFCDADDYVEEDLIERISETISQYRPDLILYSMITEYNNGERVKKPNLLKEGYYDISAIKEEILPNLCFNGTMQSDLIAKSRCCKAFRKSLLTKVMPYLDERLTLGEDDVTTFASVMNATSIYSMQNYYPYHYIRNAESMIGVYDGKVFDKINLLFENKFILAKQYGYMYEEQLYADWMSQFILYIKKEICKNPGNSKQVKQKLKEVRESEEFKKVLKYTSIKGYKISSRVFASLFITKKYGFLIFVTKILDKRRGRNV